MIIAFPAAQFQIEKDDNNGVTMLIFAEPNGNQMQIPFDADGWSRFKSAVATGKVTEIAIAKGMPSPVPLPPTMAIPGKR